MKRICLVVCLNLVVFSGVANLCAAADPPWKPWLEKAAGESDQIDDSKLHMIVCWRIAAIAAAVGDDELCARFIDRMQHDVAAGNASSPMTGKVYMDRLMVMAKVAAGKVEEAKALVPPAATGRADDTPRNAAMLGFVQALARRGDVDRALQEATAIPRTGSLPYGLIAQEQAKKGDKSGAVETAKRIIKAGTNPEQCQFVAVDLVKYAGADEDARIVATMYEPYQDVMLAEVAKKQAECGRIAEAGKTILLIKEQERKDPAKEVMAAELVKSGDVEGARKLAASMAHPGSWRTREMLVRAAMESGNWDAAAALAREFSPAHDDRLPQMVARSNRTGPLDAIEESKVNARNLKDARARFGGYSDVAAAYVAAKRGAELQPWLATLNQPVDREAVYIGAAMGFAGVDHDEVIGPELMMQSK